MAYLLKYFINYNNFIFFVNHVWRLIKMGAVEFNDSFKNGVSLMDFSANWCAPCKAQEPIIKNVTDKFKNRASIIEVDIDSNRDLATKYMVQSIPTLIIFKDGKEIKRFVGLQTENTISKSLENAL